MSRISVVWVVLSGVGGLIIGVLVTAVMNLVVPGINLTWTLIAVCLSSEPGRNAGKPVPRSARSAPPGRRFSRRSA
jgi:hypothetical protein